MRIPKFEHVKASLRRHFIANSNNFSRDLSDYIYTSIMTPAAVQNNIRLKHCDQTCQCPQCPLYGLLNIDFLVERHNHNKTDYQSYHHKLIINRVGDSWLNFKLTYNVSQGIGDYRKGLLSTSYETCLAEPDFKQTIDIITKIFEDIVLFPYSTKSINLAAASS